jgi:hypothetical protein
MSTISTEQALQQQRLVDDVLRPYVGYWFWGRPSVDDLRRDLREATRKIRPDWDLSAPGLREAWEAGDVSNFHGWAERSPEEVAAERERVAR